VKISPFIPYGRQDICQDDIDAVISVLRSDFLTQGPQVPAFEAAIATHTGAAYAVAVNSATSALHIACMALGVETGDVVWTVPTTFVASANCALYCGASVDFVDIDPARYTMCPKALQAKLKTTSQLPKVIIPVHLCGQSADMRAISAIARDYGISVIEDASHAIGATYEGKPVGDCRYSAITVFSFHPVKIITTAEGGLATTQNRKLAEAMDLARNHGITRDPALCENPSQGSWYYEQITLGYNYRMTELQAALGLTQMKRLREIVDRRTAIAARYDQMLADLPVQLPIQAPSTGSSWHLYVIQVPKNHHCRIFDDLKRAGIGVNLHYIPVHRHPYYRRMGFTLGQFPNAEAYYSKSISIPLYFGLTEKDQDRVCAILEQSLLKITE
jgi:UDP-4-amino-4,6-dideoxy-N-acetyl-beta-L-altrosamine transaminase